MKTLLGEKIDPKCRGLVYFCDYNYNDATLDIIGCVQFESPSQAIMVYSEVPNPESQIAMGGTKEEFEEELIQLHKRMQDPKWLVELAGYL